MRQVDSSPDIQRKSQKILLSFSFVNIFDPFPASGGGGGGG